MIHDNFERQSLNSKPVENVPGVEQLKDEFNEKKFTKAYHLLGQYLLLNKDNDLFDEWLKTDFPSMTAENRSQCIDSLFNWTNNNL